MPADAAAPAPAKSRMDIFSHRRTSERKERKWSRGRRKKQHHGSGPTAHTEQQAAHAEPNAAGLRKASAPSETRRAAMLRRATLALSALSRSRAPVSDGTAPSSGGMPRRARTLDQQSPGRAQAGLLLTRLSVALDSCTFFQRCCCGCVQRARAHGPAVRGDAADDAGVAAPPRPAQRAHPAEGLAQE